MEEKVWYVIVKKDNNPQSSGYPLQIYVDFDRANHIAQANNESLVAVRVVEKLL